MDDYLPATSITTPLTERKLEDMTVPPVMQAPARDYGVDTSTSTNQSQDASVWRAGWELDTIPGAMLNRRDAGITHDDDGTDPFAENKGTKFEQMPEYFTDIFNKPALAARRAQIEREQELRAVQERSPWGAAGASLALQVADPTILIPGAGLVKVGRGAYRFAGSFAKVGASAAAATAVQEAVLQSQQQLRTGEESALAVGSAFVLGGMLGGGLSLLTRPEIRTATTGLDSILNTRPGPDGTVAAGSATALTDMATKLRAGERVTTDEIQEWAKSARIEARNGREATPETIARWEEIDRQSALLERAASVARASEIEVAARTAFGGDGDRLVRGGGLQVVQSVEDLPARSDGLAHPTDVRGVFDGSKAYIVADNVTPDEVPSVLLHEVGVHYGMERMVGADNFRVLLDDVVNRANAGEARFAEALAAVPADTPAIHRGEEALAYLVENAPELGIVQRVIAAVKQFIRQVSGGKYAGLSEADIRQLAVASLRKWNPEAKPPKVSGQAADVRYSRGKKVVEDVVSEDRGKDATYAPLDRLVGHNRIPWVDWSDLKGRTIFPTIADRTAAGALYKGVDGSEVKMAIHLPGGPNYPFRENNMEAGVVWANKGKGVSATKAERAKQGQLMAVLLGDANMHQSNATVSKAFFQTVEAYVRDGRISKENIGQIDDYVRQTFDDFPGIESEAQFDRWADALSFEDRKKFIKILGGKKVQGWGGPSIQKVLDATRDPEYAGNRWGDAVIIVEPDPSQPLVRLGDEGTTPHPDYPTGIRGRVVGKLRSPINYQMLWREWLSSKEAQKAAEAAALEDGDAKVPNLRRAFELAKPAVTVTDEIATQMAGLETKFLKNQRQAKLLLAMGADNWKVSGKTKTTGGISPQEFVDAINDSPASATLTKYTAKEVERAVKAGDMRVFQLGDDGKVWFALKKGNPATDYNLDPKKFGYGDNEVSLTSVVGNEQGVPGVAGPSVVLKALQEGATALDAFAVHSSRFPNGFLPSFYRRFGFEEVGRTKFDPSYYNANQMADLKKFWKSTGWDEKQGYPDVVLMKWRGSDADRAGITGRYLNGGAEGFLEGRASADVRAAVDGILGDRGGRAQAQRQPVSGRDRGLQGASGPRLAGDLGNAYDELKGLSDDGLRNFGLTRADIDALKYSRGGSRNERIAAQAETLAKALAAIDDPAAFSAAIASRGGAVGAEVVDKATMEDLSIYGKPANAVASVTAFMNPILRTRTSPVASVRRIGQKLFSDTIYSNMHMQGRTMGPAAEDLIKSQAQAMMGEAIQKYDALYQEGRKAGMRLTKTQFSEAISAAMRRKDEHPEPAVAKAAKMWRDVVFDPLKRMAQETRIKGGYLLDPDIEAKFADSYLHRMANHKRLTADEFGFKDAVSGYMEGMMRGQYAKEADEVRARIAAFEQDKVDLSLDPDARLAELEGLDKAYEDLDLRFAREANMRREISNLTSKAVLARQKGDKGTMKAAYDEIRKVKTSGGKEFDDYMRQFYTLNRRRKNVDLGFAGMAERQDDLRQKLEDVNDANLRAMDRLVAKGQKLERDLAKLDPITRSERIAELRDQMTAVLERQDKAAERLFNQVERAEKAKARAALQVLKEKRAGGMKEALAGNTEAKASAEDAAREKALDESIRKYVAAEQKRSEQLAAIGRRMDRLDALDLDGQAAELRAAVNEIVKQQSDLSIGRGERSQRIKDRLAKVDPAQVQKRIDEVDSRIKAIEREFYDKWEIKNAGEGVDLHSLVATPKFTEWARSVANDAFDFYSGRAPEAGTVPDFLAPIKSGPLKERTLPVPDEVLEPWLENDIGSIAQKYARSMLGQIEVARKFGSTTMEDEIAEVTDAYRAARESVNAAGDVKAAVEAIGQNPSIKDAFEAWRRGEPEAKVTKERIATWLEKREQSDKDDILAGRDLLLGRYAMEENQSDLGKISRVAIAYNFARYMGGYIVGSLTDIYRPAMVHGLGHYLNHGIKPLITNLEGVKLAAKEAQKAGVGVERWTHAYVTSAAGIGDPYAQGTGLERLMDKVSKTAATWNGMTLFNDFTRSIGGIDAMDKILIAATKKTDTPYLAMLGIDPGMAQRIADQFKLHGRDIRGTLVAETDNWTDKEAVRIFRAAVSKDVNSMFVERSVGDVPLFVNRPLGRMITQFRTFNMASNQRVLMRGLQEDQGRFIGSLVAMTTIGMMVAALRSWRGGEDRWEKFKKSAENPGFLIGEGLDNSGIFALFFEGANTIEKLSQPSGVSFNPIKKPLMMAFPGASQQGESTRFVRRSPLESVLGPSAGIPQQVAETFGQVRNLAMGEDTNWKSAISLTPGASHSPFREFIQAISGNSAYGF